MLARLRISPERYFVIACVALVALTLIVWTGAAVRVTGSGLGCPDWPNCYEGRLVAESHTHAWIEFGNRLFSGFVGVATIAAGALAFLRRPFRRDLAILGALLPLGVVGQAVLGGLTVWYGLKPGWVMSHYILSMLILVAAATLAWRSQPRFPDRVPPQADRTTARWVWSLVPLGALTVFVGTAATAAGPHAGGKGTGDVVPRLSFEGASTLTWLVNRHGAIGGALGVLSLVVWWVARRRGAVASLRTRLTRICLLLAAQGALGILQYRLKLPAELVWVHVALATLLWVGIVIAAVQVGAPARAPRTAPRAAALSDPRASAARP
ncbi:MAG TPA: COX15/CtaA family protein [Solirubrobacteraceae bacterium]|nr:COX15/CtaA family protein [Solirubrobacteraceae bacterium]